MSKTYIKKPTTFTAVQWNGDNVDEIKESFKDVVIDFTQHGDYLEMTDRRCGMPSSTNIAKGEYIVLWSDNTLSIYSAKNFEASFEIQKGE